MALHAGLAHQGPLLRLEQQVSLLQAQLLRQDEEYLELGKVTFNKVKLVPTEHFQTVQQQPQQQHIVDL